ncbi:hypothetical protein ACWJJH_09715 [Endozoicomonadaceae bacterium StTr2]
MEVERILIRSRLKTIFLILFFLSPTHSYSQLIALSTVQGGYKFISIEEHQKDQHVWFLSCESCSGDLYTLDFSTNARQVLTILGLCSVEKDLSFSVSFKRTLGHPDRYGTEVHFGQYVAFSEKSESDIDTALSTHLSTEDEQAALRNLLLLLKQFAKLAALATEYSQVEHSTFLFTSTPESASPSFHISDGKVSLFKQKKTDATWDIDVLFGSAEDPLHETKPCLCSLSVLNFGNSVPAFENWLKQKQAKSSNPDSKKTRSTELPDETNWDQEMHKEADYHHAHPDSRHTESLHVESSMREGRVLMEVIQNSEKKKKQQRVNH